MGCLLRRVQGLLRRVQVFLGGFRVEALLRRVRNRPGSKVHLRGICEEDKPKTDSHGECMFARIPSSAGSCVAARHVTRMGHNSH